MAYGVVGETDERVSRSVVLNFSFVSQASVFAFKNIDSGIHILNQNLWACICV